MGAGEESIYIKPKKYLPGGFVSTEAPTVGSSNAIGQIGVHIAGNREAGGLVELGPLAISRSL